MRYRHWIIAVFLILPTMTCGQTMQAPPPPHAIETTGCMMVGYTYEELIRLQQKGLSPERAVEAIAKSSPKERQNRQFAEIVGNAVVDVFRDKPTHIQRYAGEKVARCLQERAIPVNADQVVACWDYHHHIYRWMDAKAKGNSEDQVALTYASRNDLPEVQKLWWRARIASAYSWTGHSGQYIIREFISCNSVK